VPKGTYASLAPGFYDQGRPLQIFWKTPAAFNLLSWEVSELLGIDTGKTPKRMLKASASNISETDPVKFLCLSNRLLSLITHNTVEIAPVETPIP
jgi:hypothetical protein